MKQQLKVIDTMKNTYTYNYAENIKSDVDLSSDFFTWCTGNWIKNHPKPDNYASWSNFSLVDEMIHERVEHLIKDNKGTDIVGKKMNILLNKLMDIKSRNNIGIYEITTYINQNLRNIKNNTDFIKFLASKHETLVFSMGISPDMKDSNKNVVYIGQGGVILGNRDYYHVQTDENIKKYKQYYIDYIREVFEAIGFSNVEANKLSKKIFELEVRLTNTYKTEAELQDPTTNYEKLSVSGLSKLTKFDFNKFLNLFGYNATQEIILTQRPAIITACDVLMNYDLNTLKAYYTFQTIISFINILDDKMYDIAFRFNSKFAGKSEKDSLERRSIKTVKGIFSDYINEQYAQTYLSPEIKEYGINMINNLKNSFHDIIMQQEWMSEDTKQFSVEKLKLMGYKVAYPDKYDDLSDIPVTEEHSLFYNMLAIIEYMFNYNKEKYYNKPVDKSEWFMSSYTVNAYYDPSNNEICIPGGIMNAPFLDITQDDAYNYGALGAVIAHEMTHGFDVAGSQFDKEGNMKEWWKPEEYIKFKELTTNTLNRFDKQHIKNTTITTNGNLTINENIADYGGVKIAYNALNTLLTHNNVKSLNSPQSNKQEEFKKFFIAFANLWACYKTQESLEYCALNDCHSISYLRVNGTLSLFTPWYDVFNIKPNSLLYIAPEDRAKVW